MNKKIAFIRVWSKPPINESVEQLLRDTFPEYDLDIIELAKIIRGRLDIVLINLLHVFRFYGFGIVSGRRKLKTCFWRTPYIFKRIKKLVGNLIDPEEYDFSFQLYSLYDASVVGLPNYVYTDHTHLENLNYPGFDSSMLYAQAWIKLERTVYKNATQIFIRSSNISRSLVEQYETPHEKVCCVYMGSNIKPLIDEPENEGYSNQSILFVGLDWERKGGPELVKAFEKVLQTYPEAQLTIVGSTPVVDLPNCEAVGRVPLEEMLEYYHGASVFCLPTKREPFGAVFIEAFSRKLPVVATNVGAIPDFVIDGETGYLVEVGDVDALAKALTALVGNPERCRAFGEAGYKLVSARYNWEAVGALVRENILGS